MPAPFLRDYAESLSGDPMGLAVQAPDGEPAKMPTAGPNPLKPLGSRSSTMPASFSGSRWNISPPPTAYGRVEHLWTS